MTLSLMVSPFSAFAFKVSLWLIKLHSLNASSNLIPCKCHSVHILTLLPTYGATAAAMATVTAGSIASLGLAAAAPMTVTMVYRCVREVGRGCRCIRKRGSGCRYAMKGGQVCKGGGKGRGRCVREGGRRGQVCKGRGKGV